jgi:hypothetical protein
MAEETPTTETPTTETQKAETSAAQTVPYERFAAKIAEVKTLENQLAEASQAVDVAKAWESRFNELSTEYESHKTQTNQATALLRAGIDDEDISELARWRFEKSGSEDFAEWLDTDAKNDSVLKVHLTKPAATSTKPTAPSPNTGARTAPPPRGDFSPDAVQNMSVEDLKKNYSKIAGAWGYAPRKFK